MVKKIVRKNFRKRAFKKRQFKRIPRSLSSRIHYFKRHCDLGTISTTATPYLNSFEFKLSDLPGYTEFTALYDSYMIKAVKFVFVPVYSMAVIDTTTTTNLGSTPIWGAARIYSAIDYNDASNPASINEIREYANCHMSKYIRGHKRYLKPRLIDAGDEYNLPMRTWVKTSDPSQLYYSVKLGIDFTTNFGSSNNIGKVECVYYLAMKTVR